MKRSIVLLFSLVSLALASCSDLDSLFSNGMPVTQDRLFTEPFHFIGMYNNINVELIKSDNPHIELTCPDNLIDKITTEVTDGKLIIKNDNKYNWLRSYDYQCDAKVYYDSILELEYASIGDLVAKDTIKGFSVFDTLKDIHGNDSSIYVVRELSLHISEGSGNIDLTIDCDVFRNSFSNGTANATIKGTVSYSEHLLRSYGLVHAEELDSNFVRVQSNSTNDIYVRARTKLTVWINTIGNVYYLGNPYIEKYLKGEGNVFPMQ